MTKNKFILFCFTFLAIPAYAIDITTAVAGLSPVFAIEKDKEPIAVVSCVTTSKSVFVFPEEYQFRCREQQIPDGPGHQFQHGSLRAAQLPPAL